MRKEERSQTDNLLSQFVKSKVKIYLVQFSLVQSLSRVRLFATPWTPCMPGLLVHH